MEPIPDAVEAPGLPSPNSTSSSFAPSYHPVDLALHSSQPSYSSHDEDESDDGSGDVCEQDNGDGNLRTHQTAAIPASSASRKKPPTHWTTLKACEGFDLRTWVSASGSEQKTTIASTSTSSSPLFPLSSTPDCASRHATFHPFPDLPYELRSKIWRMHLEWPRIVVIRGVMDCSSGEEASGNEFGNVACNAHWYCENRSPVLLRVCSESRREALSFFRIHLPMRSPDPDRHGFPYLNQRNPAWDRIYINPDWDLVLYQGASRSLTMPILASDLLAYDPKGEGVVHYGSNDWPQSIWQVNPDPGFGMATLNESMAFLKSFVLCTRSTSDMVRPLGEGYVHAVTGEVGQAGMQMVDWAAHSRMLMRTPSNSMIRKALAIGKNVERSVVDDLVTVEMTTRIRNIPLSNALASSTTGWVLQLAWQPPDRKISHVMHITTGPLVV
ncbi:uncharacterized protein CTRU02_201119 [Colletotrichum truncatum]|uniref:Uncharacterized protein n=1 Tax=Colletotrichum truncatum TaxID=5467 RepID=A0ACC3ZH01_COLTU|nr:uncharacterized protein CTRU02_12433 [Colletotrichum truncatum]KAF6784727.1 hypothetical protein CTRU02_12433 [Colletotrichum truncatum]